MMRNFALLLVIGATGFFGPSLYAAQRAWDGSNNCTEIGNECPGNAACIDGKCVSNYGADVSPAGCLCCACEACVCEKRPQCCSEDGYWDEQCVALCGGECGGYALDLDQVDCDGRQCGWDGCFGSCGTCGPGLKCADGICVQCVPDCEGNGCGSDGCGGLCGWCDYWSGEICTDTLFPSLPEQQCVQITSISIPLVGCCLSDSTIAFSEGETTCGEGSICRWEQDYYGDETSPGEYGCFTDYSGLCPEGFDQSECLEPNTWDYRCCKESPYAEYHRECNFTPNRSCDEGWTCGPDGVGGTCGTCQNTEQCLWFQCWPCVSSCEGKACGDDGCGGSCGNCGGEEDCIAGHCVSAEAGCGLIGERGCCVGDTLVECLDGRLWESKCNPMTGTEYEAFAPYCMWKSGPSPLDYHGEEWTIGTYEPAQARYECGTVTESSTHLFNEDPTSEYPRDCDFTPCTKDCTDKLCGDDGCGGTCGGCGDHRDCVDHQCVDRIPEPTPDVVEPTDAADADEPDVAEPSDIAGDDGAADNPNTDTERDEMTPDLAGDTGNDLASDTHTDTTTPPDNVTESEPSPGCGCSGLTAPAWPGSGVLFVLLLCIYTVVRARTQKR